VNVSRGPFSYRSPVPFTGFGLALAVIRAGDNMVKAFSVKNEKFFIVWIDGNLGGGETLAQAAHMAISPFSRYNIGQDRTVFQCGDSLGYVQGDYISGISFKEVSNITYFPK